MGQTISEHNRQVEARAINLLIELIHEALAKGESTTAITLEIPKHGHKLGQPAGCVKRR